MSYKKLLGCFAATLMFAACSNDSDAPAPGQDAPGVTDGSGYLAVNINLPTTTGNVGRAANDNFDHGTPTEYKVNDALFILFTGDSESAATVHSVYDLKLGTPAVGGDASQITTSYRKAVKIEGVNNTDHIWGLVFINYKTVCDEAISGGIVTIGGESIIGWTLNKFQTKDVANALYDSTNDFFMTNAPISSKSGGSANPSTAVQTLTDFKTVAESCKPTEAEALNHIAGSIFVERAVAKATLAWSGATAPAGEGNPALTIKSVEWKLDNIEPKSFVVRNLGNPSEYFGYTSSLLTSPNSPNYRFVGEAKIGTTTFQDEVALYRTYWAIDPTYGTGRAAVVNSENPYSSSTTALYCHENTFPVKFQDYGNTTRALLKVTFTSEGGDSNGNLYVVNDDRSKFYNKVADVKSLFIAALLRTDELEQSIKNNLKEGEEFGVTITSANIAEYFTVGFDDTTLNITSITPTDGLTAILKSEYDLNLSSLMTNVNGMYDVTTFEGGVAYYDVRIKHFGDDLTPWDKENSTVSINSTSAAYGQEPAASTNFLGRYGMVRNNWYDLNITSIAKLGEPSEAKLTISQPGKPDDNKEVDNYIAFTVNILAWAKRTQDVEL